MDNRGNTPLPPSRPIAERGAAKSSRPQRNGVESLGESRTQGQDPGGYRVCRAVAPDRQCSTRISCAHPAFGFHQVEAVVLGDQVFDETAGRGRCRWASEIDRLTRNGS